MKLPDGPPGASDLSLDDSRAVQSRRAQEQDRSRGAVDFTRGPIAANLLRLAGPLVAGNILQTVYNLVDMFWVGRLGAAEVAAVSVVFPTDWLLTSIAMGITIAGASLVAQWTGAGKPRQASLIAGQTISVAVGFALLLSIVAHLLRVPLLALLGASGELFSHTYAYISVIIWSVPFTFLFFAFRSTLRGAGDTLRPMYLTVLSNGLNLVFDPILIFGWGPAPALGVAGAAWATLLARAIAGLLGFGYLLRGRLAVRVAPRDLIPRPELAWQLLRLGAPAALDGAARSFSAVAMVAIVTRLGPAVTAAYGVVNRVMSMVWTTSAAVGQAVGTGVGQNVGAQKLARSRQVAWTGVALDVAAVGFGGAVAAVLAPVIMRLFVADDSVIALGTDFLRVSGWAFGFSGGIMVVQGAFQGAGRTGVSMALSILNRWLLRMPLAAALIWGLQWGPAGLWWSFFLSDVLGFAIAGAWLWRSSWQQAVIS
ncbi:MAG: MATE family efflux transporter [Firmicutes bacterium]|nr:MATE family efflux transporter [Bacillota bacterium]